MQSLKLKSQTLIKIFGKDTIEVKELENMNELIIVGEGNKIDEQEAILLQDDLSIIFKLLPNMIEFRLENIDISNISIARILKECPTSEISFEGSEEYFAQLRNTKINLSDLSKDYLALDDKVEISEFDVFEQLKTNKQFSLMPTIDVQELETALKYIEIDEIKIKARTQSDIEKIMQLSKGANISINIDISDLKMISEIPESFQIDISISDMSELSLEDIENLEKKHHINNVLIEQESNELTDLQGDTDARSRLTESYDINAYKKLRKEIDSIIEGIDLKSDDIEKFLEVYKRLGNKISYDWENKDRDEVDGIYYLGGYPPAHNLEGGLLNNTCVCEGYAKILKQTLACVGIQSKVIAGEGQDEFHAWNQVNIDGIWYNTDLTGDAERIKEGRELDYCLQSDEEFINHNTESAIKEQCNNSYDRNKINQYLGIPITFEFEEKEYSATDALAIIQKLSQYAIQGTRIGINEDIGTGNYKMILGNIVDDSIKWLDTEMTLTGENLAEFIKEYSETFHIEGKQPFGMVDFIKTKEAVELVVNEQLRETMRAYGIDMDQLLAPQEKRNIADAKNNHPINPILTDVENDELTQESTSLVEYKPKIWTKMINSIKNKLKQIQEGLFQKRNMDQKDEPEVTEEQLAKTQKHLPSWDLRNWPPEELQFYENQAKQEQAQRGNTKRKESEIAK